MLTVQDALVTAAGLGRVAQLVEQGTENPRVGGSIPSPAMLLALALLACGGDPCAALCRQTGGRIAACRSGALVWEDLGASGRAGFVNQCLDDWDRTSADLSSGELSVAQDVCDDASGDLAQMTCDSLIAVYVQ